MPSSSDIPCTRRRWRELRPQIAARSAIATAVGIRRAGVERDLHPLPPGAARNPLVVITRALFAHSQRVEPRDAPPCVRDSSGRRACPSPEAMARSIAIVAELDHRAPGEAIRPQAMSTSSRSTIATDASYAPSIRSLPRSIGQPIARKYCGDTNKYEHIGAGISRRPPAAVGDHDCSVVRRRVRRDRGILHAGNGASRRRSTGRLQGRCEPTVPAVPGRYVRDDDRLGTRIHRTALPDTSDRSCATLRGRAARPRSRPAGSARSARSASSRTSCRFRRWAPVPAPRI